MRPLTLTLKGFTSFKDEVSLGFEKLDLFVISGATGAGKSSLLDAMTYALFGKVPRTDKHGLKELISHGRDRMAVVLDFQVGGQPYRVARGRRRNAATQVGSRTTRRAPCAMTARARTAAACLDTAGASPAKPADDRMCFPPGRGCQGRRQDVSSVSRINASAQRRR